MANYKPLGVPFDRTFRNDLNENFNSLDKIAEEAKMKSEDIQSQVNNLVVEGDSSPQVSQALAGTPYTTLKEKHDAVDAQLADITLNVKSYGAKGDNVTDDTQAILEAIVACPIGGTVLVPAGAFITTAPIIINKNINFSMQGYINADHTGIAIDVSGVGTGNVYMPEFKFKAYRKTVNHTEGSIGIRIKNTYHTKIRIDYVAGFSTNIQLTADSGKGTVYNDISLGQVYNGKTQLHITADGSVGSWSNQNTFVAGRLYYPNTGDRTDYVQIKIDGDTGDTPLYRNNGNTFIGTSLEDIGSSGAYAKAVICNGIFNNFIGLRTEGSMAWIFGTMSYRNNVQGGTYIYMSNMTDNGTFNAFFTQGTGSKNTVQSGSNKFIAGASGTAGAEFTGAGQTRVPAKFYNSSSGGYPAMQIMESDGVTVAGEFAANGIWTVKSGTRKIAFGLWNTAPTSLTWRRGDLSFVTNPDVNGAVGYVCVSGDGTGLGTWRAFGGTASTQTDSSATTVDSLKTDFNALLARLRGAGLMAQ